MVSLLGVPIYEEASLLEANDYCFELGRDSGYYRDFSARGYFFDRIQALFPSTAMRETADGEGRP